MSNEVKRMVETVHEEAHAAFKEGVAKSLVDSGAVPGAKMVFEHGTAELKPGVVESIKAAGINFCRMQCKSGGACARKICTGACMLPDNAEKGKPTQVYLRWVGVKKGMRFESMQKGPWGVTVCGTVIEVNERDKVELIRDRDDLESFSHVEGLTLQMAEVQSGSTLGDWRPVLPAVAVKAPDGATTKGDTPLKMAAVAAMDLFEIIDKLNDEDAVKTIEVVKQRAKVSMLGRSMRKAVPA